MLEVGRCHDVVVYAVAILLLQACIEEREAGSDNHCIAFDLLTRRERDTLGGKLRCLAAGANCNILGLRQAATCRREHLVGGCERWEEYVP